MCTLYLHLVVPFFVPFLLYGFVVLFLLFDGHMPHATPTPCVYPVATAHPRHHTCRRRLAAQLQLQLRASQQQAVHFSPFPPSRACRDPALSRLARRPICALRLAALHIRCIYIYSARKPWMM
jgi:hypothetical protein